MPKRVVSHVRTSVHALRQPAIIKRIGPNRRPVFARKDFSRLRGFLSIGLVAVLPMIALNLLFFHDDAMASGISVGGVILFDTSLVLHRYPPEEYISATMDLLLDVITLFWLLLSVLIQLTENRGETSKRPATCL